MPLAVVSRSVEPEEVVEVLLLHAQGLDALPPRLLARDGLSELVQLTLSFNRLGGEALAALAAPLAKGDGHLAALRAEEARRVTYTVWRARALSARVHE